MEEENEFNNANAPAFSNPGSEYGPGSGGLTKREYFAAMAMQGLLTMFRRYETNELKGNAIEALSGDAVAFADELLKQLEK